MSFPPLFAGRAQKIPTVRFALSAVRRYGSLGCAMGALVVCSAILSGCNAEPLPTADEQAQEAASDKNTALGRSMEMGQGVETDNNIAQINQALSIIKMEAEGSAPATLEEARRALKLPDEMWVDKATGKPLSYDPNSGTVSR